jgi:hypothetical protein
VAVVGAARKTQRIRRARFEIHQYVDRLVDRFEIQRLIVEIADGRIGEAGALEFGLRGAEFRGLEPRDPGSDHEIGLEGVNRRAQRLQHVGLDHRRRAKQAACHAREQLALGQPVLHKAGVNVDRARQRDAVQRQFLIVDAPSRQPGEKNPDQREKADDETQPNHSLTRA